MIGHSVCPFAKRWNSRAVPEKEWRRMRKMVKAEALLWGGSTS
jgi:hypothetical protein